MRHVQSVINSISNVEVWANGATGLLNANSLNSLKTAVSGLSKEQALLVLSTKNLTQAQKEQVLIEAGIIASNDKINASIVQRALAESTLTAEQQKDILTKLELINVETGEVITTNACTKAALEEALAKKGIVGADAEAIISSMGLTSANTTQTISFDLLTASIWANIKALGKWLVTNPIGWAILGGTAIFGLVKAYDALTDSTEEVKERTDALLDSYNSAISEANSNAKTIESLASRYEALSKGVNNLGENVSLTADEYSEYNDIVNQIAEMFPTMITGYTDEGNAILSLKGNVEELRDAYKEAQKEAYNLLIVSGKDSDGNDIITNYQNQLYGNESFLSTTSSYIDGEAGAKDAIDVITRLTGALTPDEFRETYNQLYEEYENVWNSDKIQDALKSSGFEELTHAPKWSEITTEDLANVKYSAQATIQTYQAEIDSQLQNVRTLANAYLMTNSDYEKLDEQSKTAASLLVNSIDESIANGFENKSDVGAYVAELITSISNNAEAQKALTKLFTIDTTDMSVGEIQSDVDSYISIIADAIHEDSDKLKVRLGFEDVDTQTLINNVKGKLKGTEFDDKVGELSLGDLKIASELDVPLDSIESWEELLKLIEEVKTQNPDEITVLPSISETIDNLNTRLKPTFDALKEAYQNIFKSEDGEINFSLDDVDISTFESIKSAIGELDEIEGIEINYDDFDNFVKVLSDTSSTSDEVQDQFNKLATSIVYSSDCTEMSKDNFDLLCKSLYEMGLTNAEEVLTNIRNAQEELKTSGINLKIVTEEQAQAFLNEAEASDIAKEYLRMYMLQKQLANQPLNTSADVEALENLCNSLGVTGEMLKWVASLKSALGAVEAGAPIQAFQSQIDSANQKIAELAATGGSFSFDFNSNVTSPSSSKGSSGSSKDSNKPSEVTQEFNWIEKYLESFARRTEKIMNRISDYLSFKKNLSTIKSAIKSVHSELSANEQALAEYAKQMNAIGLDAKYVEKIKNGALEIETITGYETDGNKDANAQLIEKIEKYQDLYDKYTDIEDTIEDLRETEKEWLVKNLEYINEYYQKLSDIKNLAIDKKQDNIDLKEAQGKKVTTSDYKKLVSNNSAYIKSMRTTYKKTNAEFNKLVKNGTIEKNSAEWFEWKETLAGLNSEIVQAQINTAEWKDEIEDLKIQKYTDAIDKLKIKNEELNDAISEREAIGLNVREKDYSAVVKNNNKQISQLEKQNALLYKYQSQVQKVLKDGRNFKNRLMLTTLLFVS